MSFCQKVYPTDIRYDQLQDRFSVFPLRLSYQEAIFHRNFGGLPFQIRYIRPRA